MPPQGTLPDAGLREVHVSRLLAEKVSTGVDDEIVYEWPEGAYRAPIDGRSHPQDMCGSFVPEAFDLHLISRTGRTLNPARATGPVCGNPGTRDWISCRPCTEWRPR
jgi:hypothetical protein